MNKDTLTLHAGGTGQKEINIKDITIPDLWHVAQYHHDKTLLPAVEPWHALQHKLIMECWTLAHSMKNRLQDDQANLDQETIKLGDLADIIRKADENHTDHAPLISVQGAICELVDNDQAWRAFVKRCRTAPK